MRDPSIYSLTRAAVARNVMFRIIGERFSVISSFFMDWLKWRCYDACPMKILRWLPLFVIVLNLPAVAKTGGMTDEDREHLLVHFEMTGRMLAEEVRGLSPTQLEYRASLDRWTIRECVAHLAVAEPDYWRELMDAVKAPPDMKGKKSSSTDADIMWYGIDRVVHTKTGGGHEKVDTYKDLGVAMAKFQALRATRNLALKSFRGGVQIRQTGQ
jgi:hypothetical protein